VRVNPGAGTAELRVRDLVALDYPGDFATGSLGPNWQTNYVDATVSFDILWDGPVTRKVKVIDAANGFAGQFRESEATVTWSASSASGFSFISDPGNRSTSVAEIPGVSGVTAPLNFFSEIGEERNGVFSPGGAPATASVSAPFPVAAAQGASLAKTINGGDWALVSESIGGRISLWGTGVQLLAEGSARGHFTCADQVKDPFGGNFFGHRTGWSQNTEGSLSGTGKAIGFSGGLTDAPRGVFAGDIPYTVRIQQFGGPVVGHWTLDVPDLGGVVCNEALMGGEIVTH
jgi:hypothetical protein